jgi:hypothetical protein
MRKERKHYTAEEKVAILRRHRLDKDPVSDLGEELGLRITHPAGGLLSNDRSQNFTFASGNAAGRAAIEVRYNYTDGPVIERLYVQVN